jgi:hypothetical protein
VFSFKNGTPRSLPDVPGVLEPHTCAATLIHIVEWPEQTLIAFHGVCEARQF